MVNAYDSGGIYEGDYAPGVLGVRAKIELTLSVVPVGCIGGGFENEQNDVWVSLFGGGVNNKIEVGSGFCRNFGCGPGYGGSQETMYWFRYGRDAGTCGNAVYPAKVFVPGPSSDGSYWFQVYKFSPTEYDVRIAGTTVWWTSAANVETCWGHKAFATRFLSSHWDPYDQYWGRVGDQQFVSSATWTDASGILVSISRPYGATCDLTATNGYKCKVASNLHDGWYQWDTRQP